MGKGTIRARSVGYSTGKKKGSSLNYQQSGRELMTIDEIRGMPFEKCIVLVSGEDPIYDSKFDLKEHPRYGETGDAKQNRRFNLMGTAEYLNINSEVYDEMDTEPEEREEVSDEISKPDSIGKMGIASKEDSADPESILYNIYDADRTEGIKYIVRMQSIVEKEIQKAIKDKSACIFCIFAGAIDPRIIPGFLNKYNKECPRPVMIFCNDMAGREYIRGYFKDESGIIREILSDNGHKDIACAFPDDPDDHDIFIVKNVLQGDFTVIKESMRKGVSFQDEFGDEVDMMYESLGL